MAKEFMKYSNDEVTIIWKPNTCTHSSICWKGLIEVFNPRERPWVKMNGASTERIVEQVRKCPSGALSYVMNEQVNTEVDPGKVVSEPADILKIKVAVNGPYLINAECVIVHSDGKEEIKAGTVALCRCGASDNKPYCDGSHKRAGFIG